MPKSTELCWAPEDIGGTSVAEADPEPKAANEVLPVGLNAIPLSIVAFLPTF